jgi:hypothetical protein
MLWDAGRVSERSGDLFVDILNREMSHIAKRRSDNHLQPNETFSTLIVRCFQKLRYSWSHVLDTDSRHER